MVVPVSMAPESICDSPVSIFRKVLFPTPVATNNSDAFTLAEGIIKPIQNDFVSERLRNLFELQDFAAHAGHVNLEPDLPVV